MWHNLDCTSTTMYILATKTLLLMQYAWLKVNNGVVGGPSIKHTEDYCKFRL